MEFDNQYLTYFEYTKLGGTLEKTPFSILEFEAQQNVDRYTFGRLKKLPEQLDETKLCIFKLIDKINEYIAVNKKATAVSSENIDGYSVTYRDGEELTDFQKVQLKNIIQTYLEQCRLPDGTPYLYRGVGGSYDYKSSCNLF